MSKCACRVCGAESVNGTGDLCGTHVAELIAYRRAQEADRLATARAVWRYYVPDGDLGVSHADCDAWRSYVIADARGHSVAEFLEALSISEVGQNGEDFDTYGFGDASLEVQTAILNAAGISWKEVA